MIALRLHDVADRDHPDQPALVDDRQMTDPPLGHRVSDREEVIVGLAGNDISGHQVGDHADEELLVARGFAHDVALRQDADRALAVDGDQRADVVLIQQPERLPYRLLGAHRHGHRAFPSEDVRDVHAPSPSVERASTIVRRPSAGAYEPVVARPAAWARSARAQACGVSSRRATRSSRLARAAPSGPRAPVSTVSATRSWAIRSTRAVTIFWRRRSSSPLVF